MTAGPALPCPRCRRVLGPESWIDGNDGVCLKCETQFEFVPFPALTAARGAIAPQATVMEADSPCFFHPENRAETICEGCGRLLCPVCTVPFACRKLCPACIAGTKASPAPALIRERTLYDGVALAMAGIPMLLFPVTLVSAPVALGAAIYGWNKPGSLVRGRSRSRLVLAIVLAVLQIGAWITYFVSLWLKR